MLNSQYFPTDELSEAFGPSDLAVRPPLDDREVRFPLLRADQRPTANAGDSLIVEETIVRRRIVDPAELTPDELERLRRERPRDGVEHPPPTEERR